MDIIKPSDVVNSRLAAGHAKSGLSVRDRLTRGFLAGALLGFATTLALTATAQTTPSLVGALVLPVMIPTGMPLGAKVSAAACWLWNQIPVTLGNFVGGFLFTGLFLHRTYKPAAASATATAAVLAAPEPARA